MLLVWACLGLVGVGGERTRLRVLGRREEPEADAEGGERLGKGDARGCIGGGGRRGGTYRLEGWGSIRSKRRGGKTMGESERGGGSSGGGGGGACGTDEGGGGGGRVYPPDGGGTRWW